MNKKGFTLVEILAVLVLIGLLLGIAIPGINKISSNMKNKSYNKKVNLIESAAILWGQDNKTRLQANSDCSCYKIKVSELLSDNYLDSDNNSGDIINPIDNKSLTNSCVYVYKENNRVYAKYVKDDNCTNSKPTNPDNSNPTDPNKPDPNDPETLNDKITIEKSIVDSATFVDENSKEKKAPAIKIDIKSEKTNLEKVNLKYKIGNMEVSETETNLNDSNSMTISKNILEFLQKCDNNLECEKTYIRDENDNEKLNKQIIKEFTIKITVEAINENYNITNTFNLSLDVDQIDLSFISENTNTSIGGINDNGDMVFSTYSSHVEENTTGSVSSLTSGCWVNYFNPADKSIKTLGIINDPQHVDLTFYNWNVNEKLISYGDLYTWGKKRCLKRQTVNYVTGNLIESSDNCYDGGIVIENAVENSKKFGRLYDSKYQPQFSNILYYFNKIYDSNSKDFRYEVKMDYTYLDLLIYYNDNTNNKRYYYIIKYNNGLSRPKDTYQILTFGKDIIKITDDNTSLTKK